MVTDDELEIMRHIRLRLIEGATQLQFEANRLDQESDRLAVEAKTLGQISISLKGRVSLIQARASALQKLANDLSNTASMAKFVGQGCEDAGELGHG